MESSYLYKIAKQLGSIQLDITQKTNWTKAGEDTKMESTEEVKEV